VDDVEKVFAMSAAFTSCDVESLLSYYAPDAVFVDRRPNGGAFVGRDVLRGYYTSMFENADAMTEDMEVVHTADGLVIVHCRFWGRLVSYMGSGEFNLEYGLVFHFTDGLVSRVETYPDGDAAVAANT
jgi:ketosteroid isomerase-like protein